MAAHHSLPAVSQHLNGRQNVGKFFNHSHGETGQRIRGGGGEKLESAPVGRSGSPTTNSETGGPVNYSRMEMERHHAAAGPGRRLGGSRGTGGGPGMGSVQANRLSSVLRGSHEVYRVPDEQMMDLEELEQFAKCFKQRRIKLGNLIFAIKTSKMKLKYSIENHHRYMPNQRTVFT